MGDETILALLSVAERGPFVTIGWLYSSMYRQAAQDGLVYESHEGWKLTDAGVRRLQEMRDSEATTEHPSDNH